MMLHMRIMSQMTILFLTEEPLYMSLEKADMGPERAMI